MFKNIKNYTPETPEINHSKNLWWAIFFFNFCVLFLILQINGIVYLKEQILGWQVFLQIGYTFFSAFLFTLPLFFRKYAVWIIILASILGLGGIFTFFFSNPLHTPWIAILGPIYFLIFILFPIIVIIILLAIQKLIIFKKGLPQILAYTILVLLGLAIISISSVTIVAAYSAKNVVENFNSKLSPEQIKMSDSEWSEYQTNMANFSQKDLLACEKLLKITNIAPSWSPIYTRHCYINKNIINAPSVQPFEILQKEKITQALELCQIKVYYEAPDYPLEGICMNGEPYLISKDIWQELKNTYLVNREIRRRYETGEYFLQNKSTKQIIELGPGFTLPPQLGIYYLNLENKICRSPVSSSGAPAREMLKTMKENCPKTLKLFTN